MAADTSATIGSLLRAARIRAGMTQKDAARKAKLSAPTLCNIEQSDDCYWSTVVKLCRVYKQDIGSVVAPKATKEG